MGLLSFLFGKKKKNAPQDPLPQEKPVQPLAEETTPEPKPTLVLTPEPKPEPILERTPEPKPEPLPESKLEPQPKPQSEPKRESAPEPKSEPQPQPEPLPEMKPEAKAETKPEAKTEPKLETKAEPKLEAKPELEKAATPPKSKAVGKYEVYPEAGLFKYRLKANNGEILVVSGGYTTAAGAISGIDTFKKNVESGKFELISDKNNYAQFRLYTPNGSRLVAAGEFYETVKRAESAMESVKKFAPSEKIVELDSIPIEEIREELVVCNPVEKKPNGKIEIEQSEGQWIGVLKASNGEVLFVTQGYASKSGLLSGIETIKKAIDAHNFRVAKDKQGRWQFKLYSAINQILIVGETYGTKEAALSSIESVRRFATDAKQIDL